MATRRRFVQTSAGAFLVSATVADLLALGGCGSESTPPEGSPTPTPSPVPTPQVVNGVMTLPLSDFPSLADADGSEAFNVPGAGELIVAHLDAQTDAAAYICLSRVCTHQGCLVNYVQSTNSFLCPCHGSTYSQTGANTGGPAPAPLHSYATTFDGANVVVDLTS